MKVALVLDYLLRQTRSNPNSEMRTFFHGIYRDVKESVKFEFQSVPFELAEDGSTHKPRLNDKEKDWFVRGIVPLPAKKVWYEVKAPLGSGYLTTGLLVEQTDKNIWKIQVFIVKPSETALWNFYYLARPVNGKLTIDCRKYPILSHLDHTKDPWNNMVKSGAEIAWMFAYLTLMLTSKSTTVEYVEASVKVNKKRRLEKKTPLDSYRKVVLVPKELIASKGDGDGSPKRLHVCRSHLRHYETQTPNSVWVEDMSWKDKTGWWVVVVPEHFRGNPELGTITHDYIVK